MLDMTSYFSFAFFLKTMDLRGSLGISYVLQIRGVAVKNLTRLDGTPCIKDNVFKLGNT